MEKATSLPHGRPRNRRTRNVRVIRGHRATWRLDPTKCQELAFTKNGGVHLDIGLVMNY
jgi:hypothetical protein